MGSEWVRSPGRSSRIGPSGSGRCAGRPCTFAVLLSVLLLVCGLSACAQGSRRAGGPSTVSISSSIGTRLLAEQISALRPRRAGGGEIWLLSAGLWSGEGVFLREATMAREVFDRHLGTAGHSLLLVNNRGTASRLPPATPRTIVTALAAIGRRMDRRDDVLAVFITTHGSRDHRLLIDRERARRVGLSPRWLRHAIDWTGARWRVVVLSACYSGGFVEALANPQTLVVTAAAADRTSFGCGDRERLTYFGEAYVDGALRQTGSLIDSFPLAVARIAEREGAEGFTPSDPRFVLGSEIEGRLRANETGRPWVMGRMGRMSPLDETWVPDSSEQVDPDLPLTGRMTIRR